MKSSQENSELDLAIKNDAYSCAFYRTDRHSGMMETDAPVGWKTRFR